MEGKFVEEPCCETETVTIALSEPGARLEKFVDDEITTLKRITDAIVLNDI